MRPVVYFTGTLGLTKDHILQLWVTEEYNTSDLFKKYLQIAQQRGVSHALKSASIGDKFLHLVAGSLVST